MSEEQLMIYVELVMLGAMGERTHGVSPFRLSAVQAYLQQAQAQYTGNRWVQAVVAAVDRATDDDLAYEHVSMDDVYRAVIGLNAELGAGANAGADAGAFKLFLHDLAGTAGYAVMGDQVEPFLTALRDWLG